MEHRHLCVWFDDPEGCCAAKQFSAHLPDNDHKLRAAVLQQHMGDQHSEHCAETLWEEVQTPFGKVWVLLCKHSEHDFHEEQLIQPYCAPLCLGYIGHQHFLKPRDEGIRSYLTKMCSYVVKNISALDNVTTGMGMVASILRSLRPSQAQMLQTLAFGGSMKLSQNVKEVAVDPPDESRNNELFQKYLRWGQSEIRTTGADMPSLNFKSWLRTYRTDIDVPQPYQRTKQGQAALAIHYASASTVAFCGQWLILHVR